MFEKRTVPAILIASSLLLSACGASTPQAASTEVVMAGQGGDEMSEASAMMEGTPTAMMDEMNGQDEMMEVTPAVESAMATPEFFKASLTNAVTGDTFSLEDFQGKVVLLETMAMWCPNCLRQQKEIQALHTQLGMRDDLVSLSLDVDPNEVQDDLTKYAAGNGFDWVYAIAPSDVAREIGNLYGNQFLNPSATPMLIIDKSGAVHPLPFGIKSAADLQQALDPFLAE